jgi:hypothetical protein
MHEENNLIKNLHFLPFEEAYSKSLSKKGTFCWVTTQGKEKTLNNT